MEQHEQGGEEDGAPLCVVCANEIEFFAVGECNHPGRCVCVPYSARPLVGESARETR